MNLIGGGKMGLYNPTSGQSCPTIIAPYQSPMLSVVRADNGIGPNIVGILFNEAGFQYGIPYDISVGDSGLPMGISTAIPENSTELINAINNALTDGYVGMNSYISWFLGNQYIVFEQNGIVVDYISLIISVSGTDPIEYVFGPTPLQYGTVPQLVTDPSWVRLGECKLTELPLTPHLSISYQSDIDGFPVNANPGDQIIITPTGDNTSIIQQQWIYDGTNWFNLDKSAYISTTVNGFASLKNTNTLKPLTWYHIYDYKTVTKVPTTEHIYEGPVEEIFIFALSENTFNPEGYSKTYPGEMVYYSAEYSTINSNANITSNMGITNSGNILSYGETQIVIDESGFPMNDPNSLYMYFEDADGVNEYFGSDLGTTWTYNNGVINIMQYRVHSDQTLYSAGSKIAGELDITSVTSNHIYLSSGYYRPIGSFSIIIDDGTHSLTLDDTTIGTSWTFQGGVINIFNPGAVNLVTAYNSGVINIMWDHNVHLMFDDIYNNHFISITYTSNIYIIYGLITGRYNFVTNFKFLACDYRGVKVARYKLDYSYYPTWAAHEYIMGSMVEYNNAIYYAYNTTNTNSPNYGSSSGWIKVIDLSNFGMFISGYIFSGDFTLHSTWYNLNIVCDRTGYMLYDPVSADNYTVGNQINTTITSSSLVSEYNSLFIYPIINSTITLNNDMSSIGYSSSINNLELRGVNVIRELKNITDCILDVGIISIIDGLKSGSYLTRYILSSILDSTISNGQYFLGIDIRYAYIDYINSQIYTNTYSNMHDFLGGIRFYAATFENNTEALAGLLLPGTLYRNSVGNVKIVY